MVRPVNARARCDGLKTPPLIALSFLAHMSSRSSDDPQHPRSKIQLTQDYDLRTLITVSDCEFRLVTVSAGWVSACRAERDEVVLKPVSGLPLQ